MFPKLCNQLPTLPVLVGLGASSTQLLGVQCWKHFQLCPPQRCCNWLPSLPVLGGLGHSSTQHPAPALGVGAVLEARVGRLSSSQLLLGSTSELCCPPNCWWLLAAHAGTRLSHLQACMQGAGHHHQGAHLWLGILGGLAGTPSGLAGPLRVGAGRPELGNSPRWSRGAGRAGDSAAQCGGGNGPSEPP